MKKIAIVSAGVPEREVRRSSSLSVLYHYVCGFLTDGLKVHHVLVESPSDAVSTSELNAYRDEMSGLGEFSLTYSLIEGGHHPRRHFLSLKPAAFPNPARRALDKFAPDAIFCFDILSAAWVAEIPAVKKIVWLGDFNFETVWYHAVYAAKEGLFAWHRWPLVWAYRLSWQLFYKRVLIHFDLIVPCTKKSEVVLRQLGFASRYIPFPYGSGPIGPSLEPRPLAIKPTYLFMGNLKGLGSRSAFRFLIDEIYPALKSDLGPNEFNILISGMHGLPKWMSNKVKSAPEIQYVGFVEDLVALMRTCHAVIAPIEVPLGNRTRIVNAMAYGVPVIAHPNTAFGNPALVHGKTCYLTDVGNTFARYMRDTYMNVDGQTSLIGMAYSSYCQTFAPEVATSRMVDEIKKLF